MKLTGAAILVSRGTKVLQAAPAAYPYRSASPAGKRCGSNFIRRIFRDSSKNDSRKANTSQHVCAVTFFAAPQSVE